MAISGSNEEETIIDSTTINGWNIIDSSRIHYRGLDELVNMKPDSITIFGDARITGENEILIYGNKGEINQTSKTLNFKLCPAFRLGSSQRNFFT